MTTMHAIPKSLARLAALGAVALALPAAAGPAPVKVTGAWCRAAPTGALAGGCYVTLTAPADDRLVAVETTAADHGEIHTMSMEGGVMRMRRLADGIALPAGKAVSLKPGAEHVMIIGPKVALTPGASVPLVLKFRSAPSVRVIAPVRTAPVPAMSGMSMERR
jgi:copper(I)-binding protein